MSRGYDCALVPTTGSTGTLINRKTKHLFRNSTATNYLYKCISINRFSLILCVRITTELNWGEK